jgi:hypothetical protein
MEVYALREVRKMQRRKQESVDSARVAVVVRRRTVTLATASVTAAKPKAAVAAAKKKGEAVAATKEVDVGAVLKKASASAFRGGIAGFAAGVIQVCVQSSRAGCVGVYVAGARECGPLCSSSDEDAVIWAAPEPW